MPTERRRSLGEKWISNLLAEHGRTLCTIENDDFLIGVPVDEWGEIVEDDDDDSAWLAEVECESNDLKPFPMGLPGLGNYQPTAASIAECETCGYRWVSVAPALTVEGFVCSRCDTPSGSYSDDLD